MGTLHLLADPSLFASAEALALGVESGVLDDSTATVMELVSAHTGLELSDADSIRADASAIERILPKLVTWRGIDRFELPANWMETSPAVHRQPSLSVDAGGGLQAIGDDSFSRSPTPLASKTFELFQSDIQSFQGICPSLVGKVPGLTAEMEEDFMQGVRVVQHQSGEEAVWIYKKPGKQFAREARKEEVQAYHGWLEVMGFSQKEYASKTSPEVQVLKEFLSRMGVEFVLNIPLTPAQALYLFMVLEKIPKELYRSGYFKRLCLEETGLDMEVYRRGEITLSAEAFRGARRDLIGSLLHGVGHAMADRYALYPHEDSLNPDHRIPFMLRAQMNGAFEFIRNNSPADIYVLNWPGEPALRKAYLMQEFREFFAEMFFIFLVDCPGLFRHVRAISNVAVQVLYQAILVELRGRMTSREMVPRVEERPISLSARRFAPPLAIDVEKRMEEDIKNFRSEYTTLVGQIPGLTPELEAGFLKGRFVRALDQDQYCWDSITSLGPRSTTKSDFEIYRAWLSIMGFPEGETSSLENEAIAQLRQFLEEKKIEFVLNHPLTPTQARYLLAIFKKQPKGILESGYFKKLVIEEMERDAGLEIYNAGTLTISAKVFSQARRHLLGALLHGLGHTVADRFAVSETRYALPPDDRIEIDKRHEIAMAFENIIRAGGVLSEAIFALDWPGDARMRKVYLAMDIREFLADLHLILQTNREALEAYIDSLKDDAVLWASYRLIVSRFQNYGY